MNESLPDWLMPAWSRLAPTLAQGRLGHALLFVGPPGVGKRLLADALAGALLCEQPDTGGLPCSSCRGCLQLAAGSHPDYLELMPEEGAREIRVAQSREFSRRLGLTAHYGRRVGLIEPAEAFTTSAANSLLKTLEEPPGNTHILLVSERPSAVLATIRSRCQRIRLPLPEAAEVRDWAREQDAGVEEALPLARGAPLRAQALAAEDIAGQQASWWKDLTALMAGTETPLAVAERWRNGPEAVLLDWLYLVAIDLLKHATGIASGHWVQQAHAQRLQDVAKSVDINRLRRTVNAIVETRRLLDSNVERQLLWEALAIELWASRQRKVERR